MDDVIVVPNLDLEGIGRVRPRDLSSAALSAISPLRTDVSIFTSAMRAAGRRADEVNVAAQAAPLHRAFHFLAELVSV